jgi:hypothetical protein
MVLAGAVWFWQLVDGSLLLPLLYIRDKLFKPF